MNFKLLVFSLSVTLIIGCSVGKKNPEQNNNEETPEQAMEQEIVRKELLPLVEETVIADEKDFGEVIELAGTQIVPDCDPFQLGEPEMLIKDNYFLMQNLNMGGENPGMYMLFKLPDFEYITSFGVRGSGPDELLFPHIAPTAKKDVLTYAYEYRKNKLYKVGFNGEITNVPVEFEKVPKTVYSNLLPFVTEDDVYYYTEVIPGGRAFFQARMIGDSLYTKQIYNISFSSKHKSWSAYIGDFIVHPEGKRIAYAYKYFKRILFFDPEAEIPKVVDFNKEGVVAANDIVTLGPDNVTFYWGASCSDDYIYLTYSGRTPIQVTKENQKSDGYIYVEQFDWNGNLVRKFKLDHWGPTIVDEVNKKIYQLSYLYDDPIFAYDLPDLAQPPLTSRDERV